MTFMRLQEANKLTGRCWWPYYLEIKVRNEEAEDGLMKSRFSARSYISDPRRIWRGVASSTCTTIRLCIKTCNLCIIVKARHASFSPTICGT